MNAMLLNHALRLLAQREHSEQELRRKLAAQFVSAASPADDEGAFTYARRGTKRSAAKPALQFSRSEWPATPEAFATELELVIAHCVQQKWLDDQRYAGMFLRSRSQKGYGPRRIEQELRQRGVPSEAITQALFDSDIDWSALAARVAERRFGSPLPTERLPRSKVIRFMLYRGFYQEDIQSLW